MPGIICRQRVSTVAEWSCQHAGHDSPGTHLRRERRAKAAHRGQLEHLLLLHLLHLLLLHVLLLLLLLLLLLHLLLLWRRHGCGARRLLLLGGGGVAARLRRRAVAAHRRRRRKAVQRRRRGLVRVPARVAAALRRGRRAPRLALYRAVHVWCVVEERRRRRR
jgi:hypothetical protein